MEERPPTVWFEVEDTLRYFQLYPVPTGIQRVCLEIFAEGHRLSGSGVTVKFCRLSMFTGRFKEVTFEQITEAYQSRRAEQAPWQIFPLRRGVIREWRTILSAAAKFPAYAFRVVKDCVGDMLKWRIPGDENRLSSGDVIVAVGGSWVIRGFHKHIARLKRDRQIHFVQIVHDVIPALFPSWTPAFGNAFLRWLKSVATASDLLLTVSQYSRKDLHALARAKNFSLPPVEVIRLGSGFRTSSIPTTSSSAEPASFTLKLPERFVMSVSTLESRKNHELLLEVWPNLVEKHGADKIPYLLLVGRIGYFIVDTNQLRRKLLDRRVRERVLPAGNLTDADLSEAYRRCLFTLFPSFYEGWGLPVEESLVHGKFCLTSNRSSMPEAGRDFVDYFDPCDPADAQLVFERALFEPGYVEAREQRIRTHYRPASWRDCTLQLMSHAERISRATVNR